MSATGLPRPKAVPGWVEDERGERTTQKKPALPLPWINGDGPDAEGMADFYAFRDDCRRADTERLCCICGDPLNHYVAIGAQSGERQTSGGWGHPRCIALAVRLCPHFDKFRDGPVVAWLHEGEGIGVDRVMFSVDSPPLDRDFIGLGATFEVDDVLPTTKPMDRSDLAWLARTNPWGHAESTTVPDHAQPTTHADDEQEAAT